jgi:hypothetical protein
VGGGPYVRTSLQEHRRRAVEGSRLHCTTELDYTEQTSWMLFLKYLDDLKYERAAKAELNGKLYSPIIGEAHRWSRWAAPKTAVAGSTITMH